MLGLKVEAQHSGSYLQANCSVIIERCMRRGAEQAQVANWHVKAAGNALASLANCDRHAWCASGSWRHVHMNGGTAHQPGDRDWHGAEGGAEAWFSQKRGLAPLISLIGLATGI